MYIHHIKLFPENIDRLQALCGADNENFNWLEYQLECEIAGTNFDLKLISHKPEQEYHDHVLFCEQVIRDLYDQTWVNGKLNYLIPDDLNLTLHAQAEKYFLAEIERQLETKQQTEIEDNHSEQEANPVADSLVAGQSISTADLSSESPAADTQELEFGVDKSYTVEELVDLSLENKISATELELILPTLSAVDFDRYWKLVDFYVTQQQQEAEALASGEEFYDYRGFLHNAKAEDSAEADQPSNSSSFKATPSAYSEALDKDALDKNELDAESFSELGNKIANNIEEVSELLSSAQLESLFEQMLHSEGDSEKYQQIESEMQRMVEDFFLNQMLDNLSKENQLKVNEPEQSELKQNENKLSETDLTKTWAESENLGFVDLDQVGTPTYEQVEQSISDLENLLKGSSLQDLDLTAGLDSQSKPQVVNSLKNLDLEDIDLTASMLANSSKSKQSNFYQSKSNQENLVVESVDPHPTHVPLKRHPADYAPYELVDLDPKTQADIFGGWEDLFSADRAPEEFVLGADRQAEIDQMIALVNQQLEAEQHTEKLQDVNKAEQLSTESSTETSAITNPAVDVDTKASAVIAKKAIAKVSHLKNKVRTNESTLIHEIKELDKEEFERELQKEIAEELALIASTPDLLQAYAEEAKVDAEDKYLNFDQVAVPASEYAEDKTVSLGNSVGNKSPQQTAKSLAPTPAGKFNPANLRALAGKAPTSIPSFAEEDLAGFKTAPNQGNAFESFAQMSTEELLRRREQLREQGSFFEFKHLKNFKVRSTSQNIYVRSIVDHDIAFGIGPAGTGKTYLAIAVAVEMLLSGQIRKILLTRPAVEAGENLGFLPGDLNDKLDPYLLPLLDALEDFLGVAKVKKLREQKIIEVAPLAYMRGRTLKDAFIILDESQNTTKQQIKMFLSRLGLGSKMVITGDESQIDLKGGAAQSGLVHVQKVLSDIPGRIYFYKFSAADIIRHQTVSLVVQAYDRWEEYHPEIHTATKPKLSRDQLIKTVVAELGESQGE